MVAAGLVAASASAGEPCCAGDLEQCLARLADTSSPEPLPNTRPLRRDCESAAVAKFGKKAVPGLIALLTSDDWRVRDGAAAALGDLGPGARDAVPALMDLDARDGDSWAGWALERIGDERAVPVLVRRLLRGRGDPELFPPTLLSKAAPLAIEALGAPQPDSARLDNMVRLIELANGRRRHFMEGPRPSQQLSVTHAKKLHALLVRELASTAAPLPLRCLDPTPADFVPEPDACDLRALELLDALASFGERAAFAGPDIDRAAERGPERVTRAARRAGVAVGSAGAVARLINELSSSEAERVRAAAFESLDLPREDVRVREVLRGLAKSEDSATRVLAATVLARRGHAEMLPALVQGLSSPRAGEVKLALFGLSSLGPAARSAAPSLRQVAEHHMDSSTRAAAADLVTKLTGQRATARPPVCGVRKGAFTPISESPRWCGGDVCVEAEFRGEFGGRATVKRGAATLEVSWNSVYPLGLAEAGERLYLLSGLSHLGLSSGTLYRVLLEPQTLRLEEVASLPAEPLAWRVETDGAVVVVTGPERGFEKECAERVLRVEPDGRVSAVP